MAKDAANHIADRVLGIETRHQHYLADIRHWSNLNMAAESAMTWVKGFSPEQLQAPELKSIPYTRMYRVEDQLLFPEGSLLPVQKMPSLLWTPIEKAIPLSLPGLNHNYFGIGQQVPVRLVPSNTEREPKALVTSLETLR